MAPRFHLAALISRGKFVAQRSKSLEVGPNLHLSNRSKSNKKPAQMRFWNRSAFCFDPPATNKVVSASAEHLNRGVQRANCSWFSHLRRASSLEKKVLAVRTFQPKASEVERTWYIIDASDIVLGRLATQAAVLLRGKHKPTFAPHVDTGDFVIVINAEKISLSGSKLTTKFDFRHSGNPGGLSATPYGDLIKKNPRRVIEKAVRGMIPHNRLGRQQISKLKVYAGADHPHGAQKPVPFVITQVAQ